MRRVLFDEDVPRQLRGDLREFHIRTAQEEGWSAIQNGELLRRAATAFDVLLTADRNLQYQQDVTQFEVGIVVIALRDTTLPQIRLFLNELRTAIATVEKGTVIVVRSVT